MTIMTDEPSRISARIKRIRVDRLFGLYTYELQSPQSGEGPGLMLLYGDNGSGKTTILKLILHLLSSERGRGHKTFIAQTPFTRLEVDLENDFSAIAARPADNIHGTYSVIISRKNEKIFEHQFRVKGTEILSDNPEEELSYLQLLEHLQKFGLHFYYLGDDRRIETSHSEPMLDAELEFFGPRTFARSDRDVDPSPEELRSAMGKRRRNPHWEQLESAIARAVRWITNHALIASDTGTLHANTIYSDVLLRIANHGGDSAEASAQTLYRRITEYASANTGYTTLGLTPAFDPHELLNAIERARPQNRALINSVLEPYIAGLEAKLEALREVKTVLSRFISNLHEFYTNKNISFMLSKGFRITSANGDPLEPRMLSSGERQLLLLLCSALGARDSASIFIIDEPEISLNIKWQRMFIRALLDCMHGTNSQVLLATHSIELLAQHKRHITKLENTNATGP